MIIPVQLILSLRVYGLYNRAKWIAGFLAVLILASSAAELYVVIKLSPEMTRIALPFSDIIACEPTPGAVSHLYLGLIPAIAFDTPAFLLVLLRGVSHLRTQKNVGFRGSNLVRLLMRDSILYFLLEECHPGKLPHLANMSSFTIMDRIVTGHQQYYVTQYVHISSFTFLLWDYIITLPDEVELFWLAYCDFILFALAKHTARIATKPSVGKWSIQWGYFYLHAYLSNCMCSIPSGPFSLNRSNLLCWRTKLSSMDTQSNHTFLPFVDNTGPLDIELQSLWALQSREVDHLVLSYLMRIALPLSDIVVCEAIPGTVLHLYLGLIPAVAFDTSALLLVLVRGMSYIRTRKTAGFKGSTLLRVLMRDSILYFLVILVVYLALIIALIKLPGTETFITFGYAFSITSITATRMLINLKKL
ncbi:hypothetical protein EYR40_010895 [Pleurotus pulmonarius]|nr:hypothetical protein EYR40_010895 [Pleurotus pulmonarius]